MKKTVVITGAAKGLGRSLILEFAKNGYNVVINYLASKQKAYELKEYVESLYKVKALIIKADITKEREVNEMIQKVKKEFGEIDCLVNNACYCHDDLYDEKTKKSFMKVLEVNCFGSFLMTKKCLMNLNVKKVLNISSLDACFTYNEYSIDYSASKAAVNSLTQTFSLIKKDVLFISVMLPFINTESTKEMNPLFLESELKRTNQDKVLDPSLVSEKLYKILNSNIKTGSIIDYRNIEV